MYDPSMTMDSMSSDFASQRSQFVQGCTGFAAGATAAVALRLFARWKNSTQLAWDDLSITLSLLPLWALAGTGVAIAMQGGLAQHVDTLTQAQMDVFYPVSLRSCLLVLELELIVSRPLSLPTFSMRWQSLLQNYRFFSSTTGSSENLAHSAMLSTSSWPYALFGVPLWFLLLSSAAVRSMLPGPQPTIPRRHAFHCNPSTTQPARPIWSSTLLSIFSRLSKSGACNFRRSNASC